MRHVIGRDDGLLGSHIKIFQRASGGHHRLILLARQLRQLTNECHEAPYFFLTMGGTESRHAGHTYAVVDTPIDRFITHLLDSLGIESRRFWVQAFANGGGLAPGSTM